MHARHPASRFPLPASRFPLPASRFSQAAESSDIAGLRAIKCLSITAFVMCTLPTNLGRSIHPAAPPVSAHRQLSRSLARAASILPGMPNAFPSRRTRPSPRSRPELLCEGEGRKRESSALTLFSARGVPQWGLMLFLPRGRARLSRLPWRVSISPLGFSRGGGGGGGGREARERDHPRARMIPTGTESGTGTPEISFLFFLDECTRAL